MAVEINNQSRSRIGDFFKGLFEVITDATNFPIVDPGYKEDVQNLTAADRRNAIDPAHAKPVERLRIPL